MLYCRELRPMGIVAVSVLFWFIMLLLLTVFSAIPSYLFQRIYRKKNHQEAVSVLKSDYVINLAKAKKFAYVLPKVLLWIGWRIPILKNIIKAVTPWVERVRQEMGLVSKKGCGE